MAAVGQATAQVLRQRGWPVDLLPSDSNAAALVDAFASEAALDAAPRTAHAAGAASRTADAHDGNRARPRILYPASSRALPTIAAGLTQLGAEVIQVEAYRTESSNALDVE